MTDFFLPIVTAIAGGGLAALVSYFRNRNLQPLELADRILSFNKALEVRLDAMEVELRGMETELQGMETELQKLESENVTLKAENRKLRARVKVLEDGKGT
jgi:predicted nuclease with TOPRIM domain